MAQDFEEACELERREAAAERTELNEGKYPINESLPKRLHQKPYRFKTHEGFVHWLLTGERTDES